MLAVLLLLLSTSCAPTSAEGGWAGETADPCGDTALEEADICRMGTLPTLRMQEALDRCDSLRSPRVQDACRVALAQATTEAPGPLLAWEAVGERLCDPVESVRWRSDCWFIVQDDARRDVDPLRWVESCLQLTGIYAGDCVLHGVDRWLVALDGGRPRSESGPRWFGGPELAEQLDRVDETWRAAGRAQLEPAAGQSWNRGKEALIGFRGALCELDPRACDPRRRGRSAPVHSPLLERHRDDGPPAWRAEDEPRWW